MLAFASDLTLKLSLITSLFREARYILWAYWDARSGAKQQFGPEDVEIESRVCCLCQVAFFRIILIHKQSSLMLQGSS